MRKTLFALLVIVVFGILAACQSSDAGHPAVAALETYLQALADKDEATLSQLSCADWELNSLLELDSFQAVDTKLEGLDCQQTASGDGTASVMCQGQIVASYFGEEQNFDLSERSYTMVEQNGDWLVCGY